MFCVGTHKLEIAIKLSDSTTKIGKNCRWGRIWIKLRALVINKYITTEEEEKELCGEQKGGDQPWLCWCHSGGEVAGIPHANVCRSYVRNENLTAPFHIPTAGRGPTYLDTSNKFWIITLRYFTTTGCHMLLTLSTQFVLLSSTCMVNSQMTGIIQSKDHTISVNLWTHSLSDLWKVSLHLNHPIQGERGRTSFIT